MDATTMRKIHADYRKAWNDARDEALPQDTRDKAGQDAVSLRHQLDEASIEIEQAREDNERLVELEVREAREQAAKMVAGSAPSPLSGTCNAPKDIRERWANNSKVSFILQPETRTDVIDETGSSGAHYVVPSTMLDRIINFRLAQSGVLKANPMVLNTTNGQVMNIPTLTTDVTTLKTAEGTASTVTNPVWASVDLSQFRIDGHMLVADELFRDMDIDLNAVLGDLAGRSLGAKVAGYLADFEIGTGSTLPNSCTLGSTASTATASNTTVTFDELKAVYYGTIPEYRANSSWVCLSALALIIGTAKDDTGNYLFQPSNIAGQPDRLFGRPFYEDAYMSSMATANRPLAFGDFNAGYWVRFSGGTEISFSRDFEFTSFSTTVRWAQWLDSVVVDAKAITYLLLAT